MIKRMVLFLFVLVLAFDSIENSVASTDQKKANAESFFNLEATNLEGEKVSFKQFANHVLLIVNVASRCGFTSQYEGLKKIFDEYKGKKFTVLAFPSNQFLKQEPGTAAEIRKFCTDNYRVDFPIFQKGDVNGPSRQAVYRYILEYAPENQRSDIAWNFTKFLINRRGEIVDRFSPTTKPDSKEVREKIEKWLKE